MTTNNIIGIVITAIISYLIGSVNFAIILSRTNRQDDVRNYGSGNAGMTNMLRTYGKNLAILTALGDFAKSLVAIIVARFIIFPMFGIGFIDAGYISGIFVLLGHAFPVYFGFRGGKGVMTSLGIIFAIEPLVFIVLALICIPIIYKTRIVSLASIVGATLFPIFTFILKVFEKKPFQYDLICAIIIVAIVLFLHRENIKRLLNGTENRFEKNSTK